jgi:hydrogenase maturation protease
MKKVGVIGIGNPLRRDDGIGIVLLEKLVERKNELPENVEFVNGGTGGMNLLHILARYDVAVVIDAVNFDGEVGESKLFKSEDVNSKKIPINISTHESDILKVIQLSKKLKECPSKLFIFGIQPEDTSFGQTISTNLETVVESLMFCLENKIKKICSVG